MSEQVAFVRRCLDEDERVALAAAELCGCHPAAPRWLFEDDDHDGRIVTVDDPHPDVRRQIGRRWNRTCTDLFAARHIARHDPARVLARIAADRAILDAYEAALDPDDDHDPQRWGYRSGLEHAVHLLTQSHAGRDGWRDEWRA